MMRLWVFLGFLMEVCLSARKSGLSSAKSASSGAAFSGFYEPMKHISSEDFAAAWLVSIERFMSAERDIQKSLSMAGVSFAVVRNKCENCHTLLTRDYFDFMVEHLSSTSNQIPFGNKQIYAKYINDLQQTGNKLKDIPQRRSKDSRIRDTLGVLVYSPIAFSMSVTAEQTLIRRYFFESTFYATYRYFSNIVVFVANEADADSVRNMSLPLFDLQVVSVALDAKNRTTSLPRTALETIINGTKVAEKRWSWVKYVYFTEGDQILHMRNSRAIFDAIDDSGGTFAVVPHRMTTLPLRNVFPPELRKIWPARHVMQHIPSNVTVITESLAKTTGSCCDNGRHEYAKCGESWWYTCPDFGLANFSAWLRVGRTGFTFLPGTEHKGVCTYSPTRTLCPIPDDCQSRAPPVHTKLTEEGDVRQSLGTDLCKEMPVLRKIGPAQ